ncbi:hypothetical protein [Aureibacter tunicatorum]|uniref:Leucine-rich repeat (LRR) protein n=1 Tax=Aureibacter tunicatorum TaxID=866807 RepID=A0AAE4BTF3_9BACT|nr:hypothetical protein [Aureibacter tunicatorum]MDR6239875.1 Leucine-rich repeat (LRR) protein [Aureibacter tunicatorum]BDD04350.1 hypothetical protein AUTU_18330 [Aureibacter tunicatorum]
MRAYSIKYKKDIVGLKKVDQSIEKLWVFYKPITVDQLAHCFSFFPNLKKIFISNATELNELPKELFGYNDLLELDLTNTKIDKLSNDFYKLKKLNKLAVSGGFLSEISSKIFELPIESLQFENCRLREFPSGISKLKRLKYLSLENNRITNISENWADGFSDTIEVINLAKNKLQSLPLNKDFKTLKSLNISKNKTLSYWNDSNCKMQFLTELLLDRNNLEEISFTQKYSCLSILSASMNPLKNFPKGIENALTLRRLELQNCDFSSIPDEVEKLVQLEEFFFDKNKVTRLPDSMSGQQWHWEEIYFNNEGNEIPLKAFQNPEAKSLILNGVQNPVFPKEIPDNSPIFRVEMNDCNLDEIPDILTKLPKLMILQIKANKFTSFPKKLAECKELTYLYLDDNPMDSFTGYDKVRELTYLSVKRVKCAGQAENLLSTRALNVDGFQWKNIVPSKKNFTRLASALAKSPIAYEKKVELLKFASQHPDLIFPSLTEQDCIRNLCIRFPELEEPNRKKLLNNHSADKYIVNENSVVLVAGKTSAKKTDIRNACKELSAKYVTKYSEKVSHVILGNAPVEMLGKPMGQVTYLSESALFNQLKRLSPQFLEESNDETLRQNLWNLLDSRQDENILMAVEMMKTGGVPQELYYPMLFLYKTAGGKGINALKELLKKTLPDHLQGILKSQSSIFWTDLSNSSFKRELSSKQLRDYGSEKESDIVKKLKKNESKWTHDFCMYYGLEYYRHRERGLRYLMTQAEIGHPYRLKAISMLRKANHLNWASAYGYDGDWWREGQSNRNLPIPMPIEIEDKENIHELNLHHCRLHELPEDIEQFTGIKKLDLSKNGLKTLPKRLIQLVNLEELNISKNNFNKFPEALLEMPWLKKIIIGKQNLRDYNSKFDLIELPKNIKLKLPDCNIFSGPVLEGNNDIEF